MSCRTIGFVLTKEKDPFKIVGLLKKAFFENAKTKTGKQDFTALWGRHYSMPVFDIYENGMLSLRFFYKRQERSVDVFFSCDSDYKEYKNGNKIIISMGKYGDSVEIIKLALKGLESLGDCHYNEDDCTDDWKPLD